MERKVKTRDRIEIGNQTNIQTILKANPGRIEFSGCGGAWIDARALGRESRRAMSLNLLWVP